MRCSSPRLSHCLLVLLLLGGCAAGAASPHDTLTHDETVADKIVRLRRFISHLEQKDGAQEAEPVLDQAKMLIERAQTMASDGDHALSEVALVLRTADRKLVLARATVGRVQAEMSLRKARLRYAAQRESTTDLREKNRLQQRELERRDAW